MKCSAPSSVFTLSRLSIMAACSTFSNLSGMGAPTVRVGESGDRYSGCFPSSSFSSFMRASYFASDMTGSPFV